MGILKFQTVLQTGHMVIGDVWLRKQRNPQHQIIHTAVKGC